jgi:hypothetical protein
MVTLTMAVSFAIAVTISDSDSIAVTVTIAITVASHCCGCREPSLPPSLLRCRQPSLLPSPLPSEIAVSVILGHCSCHRHRPSPSPCRQPFLRVVALAWQESYSTNQSKECLPYFILLGQWAVY